MVKNIANMCGNMKSFDNLNILNYILRIMNFKYSRMLISIFTVQ